MISWDAGAVSHGQCTSEEWRVEELRSVVAKELKLSVKLLGLSSVVSKGPVGQGLDGVN